MVKIYIDWNGYDNIKNINNPLYKCMPIQKIKINEKFAYLRYIILKILEKGFFFSPRIINLIKRFFVFNLTLLSKIFFLRKIIFKFFSFLPPRFLWIIKSENDEFDNHKSKYKKRLLIMRPDHIGDFIYSIPSFIYVKDKFKNYSIELLVSEQNASLAESLKLFDVIYAASLTSTNPKKKLLPSTEEYVNLSSKLGKFEIVIDFRFDQDMFGLYSFLDAKKKYTVSQAISISDSNEFNITNSFGLNSRHTFLTGNFVQKSMAEAVFDFVNFVSQIENLNSDLELQYKKFVLRSSAIVKKMFKGKDLKNDYIVIAPEAGLDIKVWPKSKIINLISLILKSHKLSHLKIVILGKNKEFLLQGEKIIDLRGNTTLHEAIGIVKKSKFFIGFDSGLSHVAGLSAVQSIIIFNGSTSSEKWSPINVKNNVSLFQPDILCSPCYLPSWSRCHNDRMCSKIINENQILEALIGKISK